MVNEQREVKTPEFDITVSKKYQDYTDWGSDAYEYHVTIRSQETGQDVAFVNIAGVVWRELFGEKSW